MTNILATKCPLLTAMKKCIHTPNYNRFREGKYVYLRIRMNYYYSFCSLNLIEAQNKETCNNCIGLHHGRKVLITFIPKHDNSTNPSQDD